MESILLVLPGGKVSKPGPEKSEAKESKTAKAEGEAKVTDKVTGVRVPLPVGLPLLLMPNQDPSLNLWLPVSLMAASW